RTDSPSRRPAPRCRWRSGSRPHSSADRCRRRHSRRRSARQLRRPTSPQTCACNPPLGAPRAEPDPEQQAPEEPGQWVLADALAQLELVLDGRLQLADGVEQLRLVVLDRLPQRFALVDRLCLALERHVDAVHGCAPCPLVAAGAQALRQPVSTSATPTTTLAP